MGRSEWVVIWEVSSSEQSILGFLFLFFSFSFFLLAVSWLVREPGGGLMK